MKRESEKWNKRKENLLGLWLSSSLLQNHLRFHRLCVMSCVFGKGMDEPEKQSQYVKRGYQWIPVCLLLLLFVDYYVAFKVNYYYYYNDSFFIIEFVVNLFFSLLKCISVSQRSRWHNLPDISTAAQFISIWKSCLETFSSVNNLIRWFLPHSLLRTKQLHLKTNTQLFISLDLVL